MNNVLDFIKKNKIGKYKSNESLSKYTTFKVGGNAKVIVYPVNEDKLIELLRYLNKNNIMLIIFLRFTKIHQQDNHRTLHYC